MKKFTVILFLVFNFSLITLAQVPQSFKYQAVVRDNTGAVIANENVTILIKILQGSVSGTAVYIESHAVTTNDFGLVNLNIGEGAVISGIFADIDWAADDYFIQVWLNSTVLGTSQLLSVPYALVAQKVIEGGTGTSQWTDDANGIFYDNGNVAIGTTTTSALTKLQVMANPGLGDNEPIFEVLNSEGIAVFSIFNDAVEVNIDMTAGSERSGFAVKNQGNDAKIGGSFNYFIVSPDSTRIYIDESTAKPSERKGFAVSGANKDKAITSDYLFIDADSTRITTSSTGGFGISSSDAFRPNGNAYGYYLNIVPDNMFIGEGAGSVTTGLYNSFFGYESGLFNSTGARNIFIGYQSGYKNTLGSQNIFIGESAGFNNTDGAYNVFLGQNAGFNNVTGHNNVFVGQRAGYSNSNGGANVFVGQNSGELNSTGVQNVFLGYNTGKSNQTGTNNVFLGTQSGYNNLSGNYNVFIGNNAGYNETGNNKLFIENSDANYSGALIYGDFENNLLRLNANTGIGIDDLGYKLNVGGNLNFTGDIFKNGELFNPAFVELELTNDLGNPLPAINPPNGYLVYNIGTEQPEGYYFWFGNRWLKVATIDGATITTGDVGTLTLTSAIIENNLITDVSNSVSEKGVCWNLSGNPTIADFHTSDGSGNTTYQSNVGGLTANTTYYLRAYATNVAGTSYGNEISFYTTMSSYITISAPTGSSSWMAGTTQGIVWNDNIVDNVKIDLLKGGVFSREIFASTPSDNGEQWTLPNDLTTGSDYQIKITGTISTTVTATSENFTITVPTITVNSHSGYRIGQTVNLTWTDNIPENVKIEVYEGAVKVVDVVTSTESDGTYQWTVPQLLKTNTNYSIKITSVANSAVFGNSPTDPFLPPLSLTDVDGNAYNTVTIGTQVWMKENLKTTHNPTGGPVISYNPNDDVNNVTVYGKLYDWNAAMNGSVIEGSQGICPDGWHVPADAEWWALTYELGGDFAAGGKLKEAGTAHWASPNLGATNESGFTGLAAGYRNLAGTYADCGTLNGLFWTSKEVSTAAICKNLSNDAMKITQGNNDKNYGFSLRCIKNAPLPTTGQIIGITDVQAVAEGFIQLSEGTATTERGMCWATTENPTIAGSHLANGSGSGSYNVTMTGLSAGTVYYVRSYAVTASGTVYGNQVQFSTTVTYNGYQYKTIKIGDQLWFQENLKTEFYRNGTPIPKVTGTTPWANATTGAFCYYDNITSNQTVYGNLYNWYAVDPATNGGTDLCPAGWHVPTDGEWTELSTYLSGESVASGKIKEVGTSHWQPTNDGATNESGFTALPGGDRGGDGVFVTLGSRAHFWSSTQSNTSNAWYRYLHFSNSNCYRNEDVKADGFSVRCVKD